MTIRDDAREVRAAAPDCTSSNAAPIVDTVLAVPLLGAGGALVIAAAADSHGCSSSCFGPTAAQGAAIGAGAMAIGALLLSSAITGYGRTADCRRAREALPIGPASTNRYLLEVQAIAEARAKGSP